MYTKEEISKQKEAFWTAFGRYMQPVLPADGLKVNWVNYKTGVPGIYFKMDADKHRGTIAIELRQADEESRHACYQRFLQLKDMLHETLGEEWYWDENIQDEYGRPLSQVSKQITGVSILKNEDWPELISFFKPRIIALDEFWSMARYSFEGFI